MRNRRPKGNYKKTCSKCHGPLEENRLGKERYCLSCKNEYARLFRKRYSQLTPDQRLKASCRAYVHVYIKRGKLKKQPCNVCGEIKVQAHHEDYSKPLEIIWLCVKHHIEIHKNKPAVKV